MIFIFSYYLLIILLIVLLIVLAKKIQVAYPILLVVAGLLLSLVPALPHIHIDSELIFLVFLPPLLYEAAWGTSWRELWRWRRVIGSFAFGVVLLTSLAVAWIASQFIPGFTLALGFLLGGIVSPPDHVSVGAILKFVRVPKRMTSILEGESLLNDASSLIIFRFALLAVGTGQFIFSTAILSFGWMLVGGVMTGVLTGLLFMRLHRSLPGDTNTDLVLTLVTPYSMYIIGEAVHSSGVLSVVSGGLFLAQRARLFLPSSSRLRFADVWESVGFIFNGVVFMLIGLELAEIIANLEGVGLGTAIGYGLLTTLVLIISRLISAYSGVAITMVARNFITVAEPRYPGMKGPFILGWAGMRGVVSLATALSIPAEISPGVPFPQRNLIVFITFVVILTTLVVQGLSLPFLIRWFKLPDFDHYLPEEQDYYRMYKRLRQESLNQLRLKLAESGQQPSALEPLIGKLDLEDYTQDGRLWTVTQKVVYRQLLNQQRSQLLSWNQDQIVNEEVIRKHLHRLDLEEERLSYL